MQRMTLLKSAVTGEREGTVIGTFRTASDSGLINDTTLTHLQICLVFRTLNKTDSWRDDAFGPLPTNPVPALHCVKQEQ
jgi:hypothetical protein